MNVKKNNFNMQLTEKHIKLEELTGQENTAYNLNGAGLQVKEIAEQMGIAYETVKSYMKSIKEKLGLSKDKEITAHFWCSLVGKDFDEVRKQIISSCLFLIFILYVPTCLFTPMRGRTTNIRPRYNVSARRYEITSNNCYYPTLI